MDYKLYAEYLANRTEMWSGFKLFEEMMDKIINEGIDTEEEEMLARAICAFVAADIQAEKQILDFQPEQRN